MPMIFLIIKLLAKRKFLVLKVSKMLWEGTTFLHIEWQTPFYSIFGRHYSLGHSFNLKHGCSWSHAWKMVSQHTKISWCHHWTSVTHQQLSYWWQEMQYWCLEIYRRLLLWWSCTATRIHLSFCEMSWSLN